jgi:hypothetical protein
MEVIGAGWGRTGTLSLKVCHARGKLLVLQYCHALAFGGLVG